MESMTFDSVARKMSTVVSRRSALGGLLAGALALTAGSVTPGTEAKRRKGEGKGKKDRVRRPGERCQTSKQCQRVDGDYICGQPRIFSAERVCCGGIDALCDESDSSDRRCCYGYLCASGRCIVV